MEQETNGVTVFGMLAREYILDDNIGVLFKIHNFSLKYNYKTRCFEPEITANKTELQPTMHEKCISSTTLKSTTPTTTNEPQPGTSKAVSFKINTERRLCLPQTRPCQQDPQPYSRFKRSRGSDRSSTNLPILTSLLRATTSRQLDENCG